MKVSAIVSAYYAEQYLAKRLGNLMEQDPRPEIIVVAQQDSYEAKLLKRIENDVTYILTPDVPTIYQAWNMAIKASNCEYITNANCDDLAYEGTFALMQEVLDNMPEVSVVYGDNHVSTPDNEVHLHQRGDSNYQVLQSKCFVGPFPMWRKSLHDKYGYFDESLQVAGDYEFWLRIAKNNEKFYHIKRPLGLYYQHMDSAEHRNHALAMGENIQVRKQYEDK
jgi:hypothetical protein